MGAILSRPQCVNSSRPSEVLWHHRSGSTLAHVMACCLMAPSYHLKQCWFTKFVLLHSSESNFVSAHELKICNMCLDITLLKLLLIFARSWWVNSLRLSYAYMRQDNITKLLQIMACRLVGAKPLSEPMLEYYQFEPWEQTSVKF